MPPRRKQPLEQHDTNAQPAASSRSSRSSSSTNKHKQALAAAASRRATRKRFSEASTAATEEDEDEAEDSEGENVGPEGDATEEDEEDEDSEPVKPKRGAAARGARTVKQEPTTGRTRRAPASAAATSRRRNVREDTVSTAASDDEDEDDEQKEEEEPVRARSARSARSSRSTTTSARSTRGKKASTPEQPAAPLSPPATPAVDEEDEADHDEQQDDDDEEEEEEVKPRASASKRKKRVSLAPASPVKQPVLPTPEPESSAAEEEDGEDEQTAQEDEDVEDREETPQPPAAAKSKAKGKRRAVVQSDEDEEDELAQPAAPAAAAAQVAPPSPAPSATPRSRSTTPTPAEPAAAPAPVPEPVAPAKPAPPTALTASALASIARQAAIDHAAQAAERAKELMGKPRLVIHQLVLENFKSYKGRNTIGPFHKAFSAIVGPNGSGKSNTIDALLFVFGFRATKMRQGKFSELIHNSGVVGGAVPAPAAEGEADEDDEDGFFNPGEYDSEEEVEMRKRKGKGKAKGKKTARKAPSYAAAGGCDFATVEVWFREIVDSPTSRDDFSVVPHSQLVVARTVRRDNSTRYTVNGKNATPGEVKQLLLGKGIDLTHNRFLILQGEVESIAQMKPKGANDHEEGLLEYLEDIIGTAKYKPLIEEASVDVERLGDERAVQMNRVKLVEKEKGALESRKKAADAYLHDQLTLVSLQNQLYQRHAHQAGADRVVYEQQVAEAKAELDGEMERQKSDRERYDQGVVQYEVTKKNLKEIEDAANGLAKELATFEKAKVQLNVQKKAADTKYAKLKKSLEEDKHAAQQAQSDIRDHADTLEKLVSSKDKLKAELEEEQAALTKVMDSLRDKIEGFSVEIEQHQKSLAPWTEQIEAKQNEVKIATQQLEDVRGKSAQVAADIGRTEQEIEELKEAAKEKAVELKTLQKGRKDILAQIEEARQRVQQEKTVEAKHRAVVNSAREKTAEAKASQKASESKGHVLSAVLKLKEQGRLPGFHGRLGDLGRIDDKYDIAVSTAAASGLESLVVDTRETAEAVFDHLRKHNIGRAACIALDRFGKIDLSPIKTPQGTQRLFDLVTPKDAIYAPAFRHVLKDTLVAPSWDIAHPVSTGKVDGQRWRVVTLDGNVAEKSGAAQVGGSRPIRGKMSSRLAADDVSPQQLAKLESEEKTATVKLEQAAEQSKQAEADLKVLEKQLVQAESSIPKVEMDLEANKQDAAQKAELLAELRGQSKPDAGDVKRVAQLEKAIATLESELESLRSKASKFEDKIAALQAKIEEVGGLKLRSQKAKVSDLQDQIRHNESRLVKSKTERAKAEKDHAKATKAIESSTAKMQELEVELKDLRRQLAEKEEEAEPIRQTVEAAQAKVEEGREELGNLQAELDEQEEAIIEFKKAEAKLRTIYTEQEKLLKETTRIFEHWTAKISSLEMPEFELLGDADEEDEDGNRPPKVEEVLRQLEPEEIEQIDVKRLKGEIALLEERLEKNNADLAVLQEYKRREEEFRRRGEEFEAVSREWDGAKTRVTELRNERLVQFMQGFGIISNKLKEMYQMITLGGNAELELYDSADPFSEGILFSVMPPKKSWKNISNLSGGEKTLSSLALVFALHTYKPTPLYFLDEIDAALDFRNVSIVANYIKTHSVFSQFLIISLRNNMFELAARLVGIYKVSNQTRSIAIDNKELSAVPDVPSTTLEEEEADDQEEEEEAGSQEEDDA